MASDCVSDLLLKLTQILALGGDSSAFRRVPGSDEESGLFARLDLEDYLVHVLYFT